MYSKYGEEIMTIIILILSIFITAKICKGLFRKSFGSVGAYVGIAFFIWIIVGAVLMGICQKIGLV